MGKTAWLIAAAGAVATALWNVVFFTFSDIYVVPRGAIGIILSVVIYGWPFFVSALIAWKLPLVVSSHCYKCKEKKVFKIGTPKL